MEEQITTFYIEGKNESTIKFKTFTTVKLAKVILTIICARGGGGGWIGMTVGNPRKLP